MKLTLEGVKFSDAGRGSVSIKDAFQSVPTTNLATVKTGATNYKYVGLPSNVRVVRARARGDVIFKVTGIERQQSYDFAVEVSPLNKRSIRLISRY